MDERAGRGGEFRGEGRKTGVAYGIDSQMFRSYSVSFPFLTTTRWSSDVGAGNDYREGFSKDLWSTDPTTLTDGEGNVRVYDWGYPIRALGLDDLGRKTEFLYMGNTTPDFNLSWGNTLRWKNLSLFALLDGEFGAEVYNHTRQYPYRDEASRDQDQARKPEELKKPVAYYQVLYSTNDWNSWFVDDGSFEKLRCGTHSTETPSGDGSVASWD